MGQKRGATQVLRRSVLPLYVAKQCQRCKNVTLCQRVTETPAKSRLQIIIFTSVFNRQQRRRIAIALRLSPFFGLPCAFLKLVFAIRNNRQLSLILFQFMSHWKSHMRNICRIANTNYSNSLVKIMMVGSYKLSFFVCVIRGQIARWFVRGRRPFLLIILAQLKLFCQQNMGKQKLQGAIFSVRCSRRFFSRPQKWAEKRSEFFGP